MLAGVSEVGVETIRKVAVTGAAAAKLASPACEAVTEQTPTPFMVKVLPETEQIEPSVEVAYAGVKPESAVAESE
jgi:hypothetical protein